MRFKDVGIPVPRGVYEDLVANEKQGFDSLFRFLGVDPRRSRHQLQKVNPTSHEELIENYGEVLAALEGTKFADQLN